MTGIKHLRYSQDKYRTVLFTKKKRKKKNTEQYYSSTICKIIHLFKGRNQIVNKFWINKDLGTSFPLTKMEIDITNNEKGKR